MKKIIVLIVAVCVVGFGIFAFSNRNKESLAPAPTETEVQAPNTVTVTFPEGYCAVQIARKLEESGVCSAADFMTEVNNVEAYAVTYSFLDGLDAQNKAFALEGYIFPDTYEFYKSEGASLALSRFLKNFDKKLTEEYKARAEELGYSVDEVVILASIIQKEAGLKDEMTKVSAVFQNRLKSPDYPRLQSDVTINYVNDYVYGSPYLTQDTSKYGELYNTYKCKDLPAGAICNPGKSAIESVLYPADTNYFFFVTDSDNNYYYAETYKEHLKNCKICGY